MDLDAEELEAIRQQAEAVRHPLASLLRYKTAVKVAAVILAITAGGAALFGLSANLGSSPGNAAGQRGTGLMDGSPTTARTPAGATPPLTPSPVSVTPRPSTVVLPTAPKPPAKPTPGGSAPSPTNRGGSIPGAGQPTAGLPNTTPTGGNLPSGGGGGTPSAPTKGGTPSAGGGGLPGLPTGGGGGGGTPGSQPSPLSPSQQQPKPTKNGQIPGLPPIGMPSGGSNGGGGGGTAPTGGGGTAPTGGGGSGPAPSPGSGGGSWGGNGGSGSPVFGLPGMGGILGGLVRPVGSGPSSSPSGSPSGGGGTDWGGVVSGVFVGAVQGARECSPADGYELTYAVEEATCPVIWLRAGTTYSLDRDITVKRAVTIIGRPLNGPIIDASDAVRAFTVEAGGFLDCRFMMIHRGRPVEVIPELLYELRGSVVYVHLGASASFTGIIFTPREDGIPSFILSRYLNRQVVLMGTSIFMEGGALTCTACHFYTNRPGVILPPAYALGGEVLILAGTGVFTGCTFTAGFLFVSFGGAGVYVAILGGVGIFTGCTFTLSATFAVAAGVGMNVFIGGGVGIFTGCAVEGNLGFYAFFGGGAGIFTGAGVSVITGMTFNNAIIFFVGAGIGFNVCLGAGVSIKTGVTQSGFLVGNFLAVLGVSTWIGAGTAVYTGVAYARVSALSSYHGLGASLFIGAGVATLTNYASASVGAIVMVSGTGDITLLAGYLTATNYFGFKASAIDAFFGQGDNIFMAAGAAVITNINIQLFEALGWAPEGTVPIFIGGPVVYDQDPSSPTGNLPVFVTTSGQQTYLLPPALRLHHASFRDHPRPEDVERAQSLMAHVTLPNFTQAMAAALGTDRKGGRSQGWGGAVYVGDNLTTCSICNVQLDGFTGDAVTGPGASDCSLAPSCPPSPTTRRHLSSEAAWPSGSDEEASALTDSTPPERGLLEPVGQLPRAHQRRARALPASSSSSSTGSGSSGADGDPTSVDRNTSLLVLDLQAVVTPTDKVPSINRTHVGGVVSSVVTGLTGLPSSAFIFKIVSTEVDPIFRADGGEDSNDGGSGDCSLTVPLRAYFVSEARDVTDTVRKAMLGAQAGPLLQRKLQESVRPLTVCSFEATTSSSYFIPGSGSYTPPSVGPTSTLPALQLLDSSNQLPGPDEVQVGSSYVVRLTNIRANNKVVLNLVNEAGTKARIASISSKATSYDWTWTVASSAVRGQAYFLEAAYALGGLLAYSQPFIVR